MATPEQVTAQRALAGLVSVERFSHRFADAVADRRVGDLFTPDAFLDVNLPAQRLEIRGAKSVGSLMRRLYPTGTEVKTLRTIPTLSGFVAEHEGSATSDEDRRTWRTIWLCEVRGGRITQATAYYSVTNGSP